MTLEIIGVVVLGIALVYGLDLIAKKWSRTATTSVEVVVGEKQTDVMANGKLVLTEPSLIRYMTNQALGRPSLLNFVEKADAAVVAQARKYRFGSPDEEPVSGTVHAFIAGCCLRAREELHVSQARPLRANLVFTISDPAVKRKISREVRPDRFSAIGVHLSIAEPENDIPNRPTR